MPKLSADQARDLANQYHDLSVSVGDYRFDHWGDLNVNQRKRLEDLQWTLMNYSSDFTAQAITLTVDDLQNSLTQISSATVKAKNAIKKIALVNKVIVVASSATVLAATILSGNAEGALNAAKDLYNAATN
jgi:hypothetical protein